MPRRTPVHIDGLPLRIVKRRHNRATCLIDDQDSLAYLGWLRGARERCRLHAYVLIMNHVGLLLTPEHAIRVPQVLVCVGRRYVH